MSRRFALVLAALLLVTLASLSPLAQRGPASALRPGVLGKGVTLLPNGWRIAPVGRHWQIGDLPLNMTWSPDGRYLIVTNNGWSKPTLTIFDALRGYVLDRVPVEHAWLGLAWSADGSRLYSSGAAENTINEFTWSKGTLKQAGQIVVSRPERRLNWDEVANNGFIGGLVVSPDGKWLYASQVLGEALSVVSLANGGVERRIPLGAEAYTAVLSPDAKTLFVSLWGGAKVVVVDTTRMEITGEIPVGGHPNAMVLSKDGQRLFVACANTNAVWVVDLASMTAKEQISVSLYPNSPQGTTPNALAVSPDGKTLLVANADNNAVAVVNITRPGASVVEGFVPVGWYPTGVLFDRSGTKVYVLNGKGLATSPNPRGANNIGRGAEGQYTGNMFQGALSVFDLPDAATLKQMTARVYELTPYSEAKRLTPADAPAASPIPRKVGDPSPIKHVFYIVRENRTYDQVLGDVPAGNGDPTLTIFGEEVTPNAHALVNEFTLFDNFYVDAEVSYDGHAFSMGAIATDVVEKMWPTNYGQRGGIYLSEGGWRMRTPYGNIAAPAQGYLWDHANRAGVSVRSYGEFSFKPRRDADAVATVPGLEGKVSPKYPPYDLSIPDNQRVDIWLEEFTRMEADGTLPRLSIIRLGNDHTAGTQPGLPTPRAFVAENDTALGRIVEAISKSSVWKESAIFVLEDDAQNGPDHVDAHRSVALVVSPFTKRRHVDSTLYTTSGILRTMELILGLPPMTQYDAAATPMYNAFQPTPNLAPYAALPARVSLTEKNDWNSPGAAASLRMNLRDADMAPELELNEIIWKSIRGPMAVMPPPRRTAFIRSIEDEDDEAEAREGTTRNADDEDDDWFDRK